MQCNVTRLLFISSVKCSQFKGMTKIYDPAEKKFGPEYKNIIINELPLQPVDHFICNCWKRKHKKTIIHGLKF